MRWESQQKVMIKRNGDEKRDVDGKRDCHDTTGF